MILILEEIVPFAKLAKNVETYNCSSVWTLENHHFKFFLSAVPVALKIAIQVVLNVRSLEWPTIFFDVCIATFDSKILLRQKHEVISHRNRMPYLCIQTVQCW